MAGYKREVRQGVWRLEYQVDGEKYSRNVKAKTPTQAEKELARFVTEIEEGKYTKESKIRFVEFAQLWLDKYVRPNLSDTTIINYKNQLNKYILPYFGNMQLSKIRKLDIQDFANKLVAEHNLSSKTVKNYIIIISSIFQKGVEWEIVKDNVARNITIPRNDNKPKKEREIYNYDELKQLLECLEKEPEPFKTMLYISIYTGARRGEVLGLRWKDIDFDTNTIHIVQNKIRKENGTKIKETKNKLSRKSSVPKKLIEQLQSIYNGQDKNDLIFDVYPATYTRQYSKFLKKNNLKKITLHDIRHTNGSILAAQGVDIVTIAKRLGHLPATASTYYLHALSEEDLKASEKLNNLF